MADEIVVKELFVGLKFATDVRISERARKKLTKFARKSQVGERFARNLERYASAGFIASEGDKLPIRHKGNGVYSIQGGESLFRLIGFYEGNAKTSFIVMDAFEKHGQRLRRNEADRVKRVAKIKRDRGWRRG